MADQFFYTIPISFRFDPTDEELIRNFLIPKVRGSPLPWNGIVEKELYGDNASPWDVFSDIDSDYSFSLYCNTKREAGKTKKTVYVFTKVKKAAPNSKKRTARRAGCGTWSGQTGSKDIVDFNTGDIIGCTKMLSFQYSKEDIGDFGHWIMHEYSLPGEWKTEIVLCRITRCTKNSPRRPIHIPVVADTNNRATEDQESGATIQKTTAGDVQRLIMNSDDHHGQSTIPPPLVVVEETNKSVAEDDQLKGEEERGCKKQKTVAEADWNLTADVVEEDWNLMAEDIERLIMNSDDHYGQSTIPPPPVVVEETNKSTAEDDRLKGEQKTGAEADWNLTADVVEEDWNLMAEGIERLIMNSNDHHGQSTIPPPQVVVEETDKRAAEDDQLEGEEERGCKKQRTAAEAAWNLTADVVEEDWNLTAEDIERLIMNSDDHHGQSTIPPPLVVVEETNKSVAEDDQLKGEEERGCKKQKTVAEADWNLTADVVEEDWNLMAEDIERLIMNSDDHYGQSTIPPPPVVVEETNKSTAEDDRLKGEQKTGAEADWNLTADVVEEDWNLMAEGIERLIMNSNDHHGQSTIPPPQVVVEETDKSTAEDDRLKGEQKTGAEVDWNFTADVVEEDWNLTVEEIERMMEFGDDEKSSYVVEGCTLGDESVGALPFWSTPSKTAAGNDNVEWLEEENGVVNFCMDEFWVR